jgi:Four helix bundle sensory module for signal transduction
MKTRTNTANVPWLLAGVVFLALLVVLVWHFRQDTAPAQQLAAKATRVDLVGQMQLALASASEAEKSAVLAITDQDSQTYADQARASTLEVERESGELGPLLEATGIQGERELLRQFSEAFGKFRRVDDEVLSLAVQNTNLKAYALLFGPAAETVAEMDAALSRVVAKHGGLADAKKAMALGSGARIGVLRIQILLAPHIAEESDAKMDQMEATMAREEVDVRKDLDDLVALEQPEASADLTTAASSFAHYVEIKAQILKLSRANTNVRSLALSLKEKRKAMSVCLDALASLKQAIVEEPIAGVTYGRPAKPR